MTTTKLDLQPTTFAGVPEGTPIVMLNLLRYREVTESGRPARDLYYEGYVGWFVRHAAQSELAQSARAIFLGAVTAQLVAPPDERWDELVLVEYPSIGVFRSIVESAAYARDAAPHREASLEDWRLLAMVKREMP